jgi:phage baseplate assembly protein gpV
MADSSEKLIRIGRVSSVNTSGGTIRVTYPDRDDSVTAEIPVFSFTDEYKMPPIGAEVLVLHLSNGAAAGVMMGRYWNSQNTPPAPGSTFRKEMGETFGQAYMEYDGGTLTIHADKLVLEGAVATDGNITAGGNITTTKGDVKAGGKSLKDHKHTDSVGGTTSTPN